MHIRPLIPESLYQLYLQIKAVTPAEIEIEPIFLSKLSVALDPRAFDDWGDKRLILDSDISLLICRVVDDPQGEELLPILAFDVEGVKSPVTFCGLLFRRRDRANAKTEMLSRVQIPYWHLPASIPSALPQIDWVAISAGQTRAQHKKWGANGTRPFPRFPVTTGVLSVLAVFARDCVISR